MNLDKYNEAKNNVKIYLADGLIKEQKFDENIYTILMKNYRESLKVANKLEKENLSDLWAIVSSYYSMFYIAQAYLLKLNLKVGHKIAHKVTSDALIVYVKDKLKESILYEYELAVEEALTISENLIETFDMERVKRSRIQYETPDHIKHSKAQTSIKRANEFGLELEKLM